MVKYVSIQRPIKGVFIDPDSPPLDTSAPKIVSIQLLIKGVFIADLYQLISKFIIVSIQLPIKGVFIQFSQR